MDSHLLMTFGLLVAGICFCSAGVVPAAVAVAPAPAIAYSRAVPYSVPPHVSRVDINTKALAAPIIAAASPIVAPAAPIVAPGASIVAPAAGPFLTGYPGPAAVSAPILAAPGFIPTYAGGLASPFVPFAHAPLNYGPTILG